MIFSNPDPSVHANQDLDLDLVPEPSKNPTLNPCLEINLLTILNINYHIFQVNIFLNVKIVFRILSTSGMIIQDAAKSSGSDQVRIHDIV
jgi:hypothetical protein